MKRPRFQARGLRLSLILVLAACAREEMPPGTGPDFDPPAVAEMFPARGAAVPDLDEDAYIRFDEPLGDPKSLARLVETSPAWAYEIKASRRNVRIRPVDGWRPGVVYTFRIPPGLRDLVRNQTREAIELQFTTGYEFFETLASGVVWDRETVRTVRDVAVQVVGADSVPYSAVTDTSGSFSIAGLPVGDYWAFAFRDQNRNRIMDRQFEPHDSGLVSLSDPTMAVRLEFWLATPDSTPPVLAAVEATDSLAIRLEFDDLLEPDAGLDSASVRVTMAGTGEEWSVAEFVVGNLAPPDSTPRDDAEPEPARAGEEEEDGLPRPSPGDELDRAPAAPQSVAPAPIERARPQNFVSVRLGRALEQGTYEVSARGFTNLWRLTGGGDTTMVYEPPPLAPQGESVEGEAGAEETGSEESTEAGTP